MHRTILLATFAILLSVLPALYNGFPFIFPETWGYLLAANKGFPNYMRATLYPIFFRAGGISHNPWLWIIVQSAMSVGVVIFAYRALARSQQIISLYVLFILLAFGTPFAIFNDTLLADFSTPLVIILIFILMFFYEELSLLARTFSVFFLLWCIGFHLSHIPLSILLWLIGCLVYLFKLGTYHSSIKSLAVIASTIAFSAMGIVAHNYIHSGTPSLSRWSGKFLFARYYACGPLKPFARQHCEGKRTELCALIQGGWNPDDANEVLWSKETRRVIARSNNKELLQLTRDGFIANPRPFIGCALDSTWEMLSRFDLGGVLLSYEDEINQGIAKSLPDRFSKSLRSAKQNQDLLPRSEINTVFTATFLLSSLFSLYSFLFLRDRMSPRLFCFLIFVFFAWCINIGITAALSTVASRYKMRMAWLVTFLAFTILVDVVQNRRHRASVHTRG